PRCTTAPAAPRGSRRRSTGRSRRAARRTRSSHTWARRYRDAPWPRRLARWETGRTPGRQGEGGAVAPSARRHDVLVQGEGVVGVVGPLDPGEAVVAAPEVGLDPAGVIGGHEVDVAALAARPGVHGVVVVPHPPGVGLVVGRVGPGADDDLGERLVPVAEGRL